MIVFDCSVCRTKLSAQPTQGGAWVLCPNCRTKLQVPKPAAVAAGVATSPLETASAGGPQRSAPAPKQITKPLASTPKPPPVVRPMRSFGRLYGFNCSYCSSRLEATESMAAQDGQCPTCGNSITIPIKDRFGRLIDPKTKQIIKQDPHPVHAYAAAGDRAPVIVRQGDKQTIRCGRCSAVSPITANNCKACGMPFTMEGTTIEASGGNNRYAIAALVLGIVGLLAAFCFTPLIAVIAVIFGSIAVYQILKQGDTRGGIGMAAIGIVLGSIGLTCWAYNYFH